MPSSRLSNDDPNSVDDPPTEPVYELEWEVRNQIVASLTRYTKMLFGKTDDDGVKEQLMSENLDLHLALVSLPLKSAVSAGSHRSGELVLDLDLSTKLQAINSLAANHSLVFDCASPGEAGQTVPVANQAVCQHGSGGLNCFER